ncbi:MAG TPA: PKD domain-containing protein [Solirubrobacteraceae bacterium]|nr:PKD domain-containing protein [Solirubrobacteraceae bacterium]
MTIFARSLSSLAHVCMSSARGRILAGALAASLAALLLLAAPPARAVVGEVVPGTKVGLQPRNGTTLGTPGAEPETFANENGNAVLHGTNEYAVYWDPTDRFHHEWLVHLDGFFQQLGYAELGTPFADISQYRDRSNAITPFHAAFKGSYSDTTKFPAVSGCTDPHPPVGGGIACLTDAQLREQLQSFIATHDLPTGMSTVYFLMTPPSVTVCLDAAATHCSDYKLSAKEEAEEKRESVSYHDSFCSYHGDINPDSAPEGDTSTILYAAIPWTAGSTGGGAGYDPGAKVYTNSFDCQDGGWYPEKGEEKQEKEKELSAEEEAALAKDTPEKRKEAEEARELEAPHVEEPNQEKGEAGGHSAGLSDVLIDQISEEEMNTVTDPLLNAWHDGAGNEVTDLCRNIFGNTAGPTGGEIGGSVAAEKETLAGTLSNVTVGGRYYINNVFDLAELGCVGGVGLVARFTAPDPVNAGEIVGVDGMESSVSMISADAFGASGPPTKTYSTFSWNFGDGTPEVKGYAPGAPTCELPWLSPCAASAFHSYQYGGTYLVTLTITDVGGDKTNVTHEVTVNGPPPPAPPAPPAAATGSAASTAGGSSAAGSGAAVTPSPVAAAAIVSRALKNALHGGLVVRYSVNEQVAGHFEVLLSRATARRLGIGGAPAVGLPAGTPPQVVIAKAILVTTTGGRSSIKIQFSKHTAERLGRLHKVSLMLRLIVRNAASHNPATTTVLSNVTLD